MDAIREFFYWTASIALILFSLFVIALFVLLFYIKRMFDRGLAKLDSMSESVHDATRTWRNLTLTRFIIKTLRLIF